jgi:hypothetical protein
MVPGSAPLKELVTPTSDECALVLKDFCSRNPPWTHQGFVVSTSDGTLAFIADRMPPPEPVFHSVPVFDRGIRRKQLERNEKIRNDFTAKLSEYQLFRSTLFSQGASPVRYIRHAYESGEYQSSVYNFLSTGHLVNEWDRNYLSSWNQFLNDPQFLADFCAIWLS